MRLNINKTNNDTSIAVRDNVTSVIESNKVSSLIELERNLKLAVTDDVELVFLFDSSGSVAGTETKMMEHFMDIITDLSVTKPNCLVTLCLFSEGRNVVYFRKRIDEVKKISYSADGGSAIYESISMTISEVRKKQKSSPYNGKKTICTIMTDGEDNQSTLANQYTTRAIIEEAKRNNWEFIYLARNLYDTNVALGIGIEPKHIGIYTDSSNLAKMFNSIENAILSSINDGEISDEWTDGINNCEKVLRLTDKSGDK